MKNFIKNRLSVLLNESKKDEYQYQMRNIGDSNVYYRKNKKDKHWEIIDEKDFEITCKKCDWHWMASDSNKSDLFICHKCDHDNESSYVK
jgi:hypothetical protein